jgi:O-glycosyl hydrolase
VVGYHSYWTTGGDKLVPYRQRLKREMARYPGWQVWQTEYCVMEHKRDLSMATALRVAQTLHADLAIADCAAWGWWLAVSKGDYKDGLIYTDWQKPGDPETIHPSKILWALGNYSRFIRPGMVRVAMTGADDFRSVLGSAWLDPAAGRVVVVYVNSGEQPSHRTLRVTGDGDRTPVAWQPYVTSDTVGDDLKPYPTAAGPAIELPASSVVTLVGQLPGNRAR